MWNMQCICSMCAMPISHIFITSLLFLILKINASEPYNLGDNETSSNYLDKLDWNHPGVVPRDSRSAVCHAQCKAMCTDTHRSPTRSMAKTRNRGPCEEVCIMFRNDDWIADCSEDKVCIISCQHLNNGSMADFWRLQPDLLSEVHLEQTDSRTVHLSWGTGSNSTNYTVTYVIELLEETVWKLLAVTYDDHYEDELDVCAYATYRVAAVNQFGSKGFSMDLQRHDLPVPGLVTQVCHGRPFYSGQYFYVTITFRPPTGWRKEDIVDYAMTFPADKVKCEENIRPPIPIFDSINDDPKFPDGKIIVLRIFESGYKCIYKSGLRVVSKCGIFGDIYTFTMDFSNCSTIEGFDCQSDPFLPPGNVEEVFVKTHNTQIVSLSWNPPNETGSSYNISQYLIQWGPIDQSDPGNPSQQLSEEDRIHVPGNEHSTDIPVLLFDCLYGVKVIPLVDSYINTTIEYILLTSRVQASFTLSKTVIETSHLTLIILFASVLVFLISGLLFHTWRKKKLTKGSLHRLKTLNDNPIYLDKPVDEWEVDRSQLVIGADVLGSGAFGRVTKGELYSGDTCITVAVKVILKTMDDLYEHDFLKEIQLMKNIGKHPNIVSIVGACTQSNPLCLIVDYVPHGDLLHFLRCHRQSTEKDSEEKKEPLTLKDLLRLAQDIANGMEYLSQKGFVHRDLACRNILVGENNVMKIGDFGLTRYIYDDKIYVTQNGGKLPLKWMAIEAIFDLEFTSASDVWSFGVVLFELVTLGGAPYPSVCHRSLLRLLRTGYRMPRPSTCPHLLYKVMCECWDEVASRRPTFSSLQTSLHELETCMEDSQVITLASMDIPDVSSDSFSSEDATISPEDMINPVYSQPLPVGVEKPTVCPPRKGSPRIPQRHRVKVSGEQPMLATFSNGHFLCSTSLNPPACEETGGSWPAPDCTSTNE